MVAASVLDRALTSGLTVGFSASQIVSSSLPSDPGVCIVWSKADTSDARMTDCNEPHNFEQAGTVDLSGSDISEPSANDWQQIASRECPAIVSDYLGGEVSPEAQRSRVFALVPTNSAWRDGDKLVRCGISN
ncbi:septum formation family protein [Pseudonocardia sediminis]|uniref:septum formation family protein n=1 Tax=Pseudonocardia sediminis TaxID=1397368 RepID=UPI003BF8F69C